MELQIKKFENSTGVIIPRAILQQLGVRDYSHFEVTILGDKLILQPVRRIRDGWAQACKKITAECHNPQLIPLLSEDNTI